MKEVLKGIWPHAPLVNCRKDKSRGPMTRDPAPTQTNPDPQFVHHSVGILSCNGGTLFDIVGKLQKATTSRRRKGQVMVTYRNKTGKNTKKMGIQNTHFFRNFRCMFAAFCTFAEHFSSAGPKLFDMLQCKLNKSAQTLPNNG